MKLKLRDYLNKFLLLNFLLILPAWSFTPEGFNDLAIEEEKESIDVIPLLNLKKGDHVADLGAGGGYFSVKLAREVGNKGIVYAIDIDQDSLDYIKMYAKKHKIKNVKTILATEDDAKLPKSSVDFIFIRNTYHHFDNCVAYFTKLSSSLKPGGRIAIIDYEPKKLKVGRKFFGHHTKEAKILKDMDRAGYKVDRHFNTLKIQSFNIFVRSK